MCVCALFLVRVAKRDIEPQGVCHGDTWREMAGVCHTSAGQATALQRGPCVSDHGLEAFGSVKLDVRIKTFIFCFEIPLG